VSLFKKPSATTTVPATAAYAHESTEGDGTLLSRTAVIANFFQASCEDACVIVCASVIRVRENPCRECVVGRFWMMFLRVPKRALGLVENGRSLERTAACSTLRGKAGLKVKHNMVVCVRQMSFSQHLLVVDVIARHQKVCTLILQRHAARGNFAGSTTPTTLCSIASAIRLCSPHFFQSISKTPVFSPHDQVQVRSRVSTNNQPCHSLQEIELYVP